MKNRITPSEITKLKTNEIIVFGSNAEGNHAGGLAKLCADKFKAKNGVARGTTGKCYAIDTMSGLDAIKEQIEPFIAVAKSQPKKTFLLTLIGCGIAGYKAEEIAPLFEAVKDVDNIYMPQEFWDVLNKPVIIRAWKAFDKDLKCRDFQYEVGKEYSIDDDKKIVRCGEHGFHACENPMDVFNYYDITNSRLAEVEMSGDVHKDNSDTKIAARNIKIKAEVTIGVFIKASVDFVFGSWFKEAVDKTKDKILGNASSGYYSTNASSGNNSTNASSGNFSTNASSGENSKNASSGNNSKNASSGENSTNASSGENSKNASSGENSKNASSGNFSSIDMSGENNIGSAIGINSKIKGVKGNLVCLVHYNDKGVALGWVTGIIGEKGLKAETWYKVSKDGKFEEVK